MQTTAWLSRLDLTLATLILLQLCCMFKVRSMEPCQDLPLSLCRCCRLIAHSTRKTGVASPLMEAVEMCGLSLSRVFLRYTVETLLMFGTYEMMSGLFALRCKHSAFDCMIEVVLTTSSFPPSSPVNIIFLFTRLQRWFSLLHSIKCCYYRLLCMGVISTLPPLDTGWGRATPWFWKNGEDGGHSMDLNGLLNMGFQECRSALFLRWCICVRKREFCIWAMHDLGHTSLVSLAVMLQSRSMWVPAYTVFTFPSVCLLHSG